MPRKIKLDEHPEDMIEQLSPKYDVSAIEIHYAFMAEDRAIIAEKPGTKKRTQDMRHTT